MAYQVLVLLMDKIGMPEEHAVQFIRGNIRTPRMILVELCRARDRMAFSEWTGIPHQDVLDYVHTADFHRIKGIGLPYIRLLRVSGCRTVKELSYKSPRTLHTRLFQLKRRGCPSINMIRMWIEQAKQLRGTVQHR